MIVFNAEPYGYSEAAVKNWEDKGYVYLPGSWEMIDKTDVFTDVLVLIVRLSRRVTTEVLVKFPDLKSIVTATTGLDHLDLKEIEARKIKLISLREHKDFLATIPSTAELTWGLILALLRKIPAANESVKKGEWKRDLFRGYQLKGKTIGIIGLGRTGKKIASFAKAFEMIVKYYDPLVEDNAYTKIHRLNDLLSQSDILSIHVHLTEETNEMINEKNSIHIKSGMFLINTSRGKVWNEHVIANLLETGKISGVATDVLENELTDFTTSPLWKKHADNYNVIITPHIGGATWDAMNACEEYISFFYVTSI